MKVYIAGPMTGYVDYNRAAFDAAAAHLRAKGYEVVSPAELDAGIPAEDLASTPHWVFMRRDIRVLVECDLIYLLPGWVHSKGASLEARVADGVGIDRLEDADKDLWRTFEGEPEISERQPCDVVPLFADIDYAVDDSLPPNTLRIESGPNHVDFEISWADGEMTLERKAAEAEGLDRLAESYQPGDQFPNVGYVRQMTGLPAEHLARRRLSTMEVAEAVNARYVATCDGRGSE